MRIVSGGVKSMVSFQRAIPLVADEAGGNKGVAGARWTDYVLRG